MVLLKYAAVRAGVGVSAGHHDLHVRDHGELRERGMPCLLQGDVKDPSDLRGMPRGCPLVGLTAYCRLGTLFAEGMRSRRKGGAMMKVIRRLRKFPLARFLS